MSPRIYAAINEASRIHGERIRKTRLGLGLTQQEVADMFGIERSVLTRLEAGHYNITHAYPKYQILNERMRIWAEMNKGGRKKKYAGSGIKKRKKVVEPDPETLLPIISSRSRFWNPINQQRKKAKGDSNGKDPQ